MLTASDRASQRHAAPIPLLKSDTAFCGLRRSREGQAGLDQHEARIWHFHQQHVRIT
jgi:hypothetical protein